MGSDDLVKHCWGGSNGGFQLENQQGQAQTSDAKQLVAVVSIEFRRCRSLLVKSRDFPRWWEFEKGVRPFGPPPPLPLPLGECGDFRRLFKVVSALLELPGLSSTRERDVLRCCTEQRLIAGW
jgi:hypothetical protein